MIKNYKLLALSGIALTVGVLSTAFMFADDTKIKQGKYKHGKGFEKSANGTKTAYTQSAHDQTSPGTCNSCHSGGAATPVVNLTASPAFGVGNTYVPGQVYTISYTATGYSFFGFDLEMNDGNTTTSMTAGTLAAGTNSRYTANPYNQGFPSNISHNAKIATGQAATFTWTAPTNGAVVYLFSNVVGVNGNNNDNGDKEAFYNLVLNPANLNIAEANSNLKNLSVYPNPAKDFVTVNYALANESDVAISILDLNGKVVNSISDSKESEGEKSVKINTSAFPSGIYFLNLNINGVNKQEKLIIQ